MKSVLSDAWFRDLKIKFWEVSKLNSNIILVENYFFLENYTLLYLYVGSPSSVAGTHAMTSLFPSIMIIIVIFFLLLLSHRLQIISLPTGSSLVVLTTTKASKEDWSENMNVITECH